MELSVRMSKATHQVHWAVEVKNRSIDKSAALKTQSSRLDKEIMLSLMTYDAQSCHTMHAVVMSIC